MLRHRLPHARPTARDERGATLIEFAFACMVFFMVVFFLIQFGIVVWRYNHVSNLAQEGARYAIVRGAINTTACAAYTDVGCSASEANVQDFVVSRSLGLVVASDVSTTAAPSSLDGGETIGVTVASSYTPAVPFVNFTLTTLNLTSTVNMVMMR
jgi:Flp pilus assembly protein TadG